MPIHLFNPPEPSGQPTTVRSQLGAKQNGASQCGTCQCVPPFWQIIGKAQPGAPAYTQLFMSQILRRDFITWDSGQTAPCQWGCSFDLSTTTGLNQAGTIILNSEFTDFGGWAIMFYGIEQPGTDLRDIEQYVCYSVNAPPNPQPFRCLSPNLFQHNLSVGSGNFVGMPLSIIIQPFWP